MSLFSEVAVRSRFFPWTLILTSIVLAGVSAVQAQTAPVAPRVEVVRTLHGRTWTDSYDWMKRLPGEALSSSVQDWIQVENAYSRSVAREWEALENQLLVEMRERLSSLSSTVPSSAVESLGLIRTLRSPDQTIEARLYSNGTVEWIRDSEMIRQFQVKNPLELQWAFNDSGQVLLYVDPFDDLSLRQVWAQKMTSEESTLFFEAADPRTTVQLSVSRDGTAIKVSVQGYHLESPVVWRRNLMPWWVGPQKPGWFIQAEPFGEHWLIKSNHGQRFSSLYQIKREGPFEIEKATLLQLGSEAVDYTADKNLENDTPGLDCFDRFCLVIRKREGRPEIQVLNRRLEVVDLLIWNQEPYFYLNVSPEWNSHRDQVEIRYSSFLHPNSIYRYRWGRPGAILNTNSSLPKTDLAKNYVMEQVHFTASDGVLVPITWVRAKSVKLGPQTPVLLQAYGAYGSDFYIGYDLAFKLEHAASLLNRGFVFAFAHVRGGGEKGLHWYWDGNRENKGRSILDFFESIDFLQQQYGIQPQKTAIAGFSAGGILMGNLIAKRPERVGAVLIQQGFLDLIHSQMDPRIPFVQLEYSIWGDPRDPNEFEKMWTFDPYLSLQPRKLPPVMIRSSVDDSVVLVHEALKYTSKLRESQTGSKKFPILEVLDSGLGGHDGRTSELERDVARNFAFILSQLGM